MEGKPRWEQLTARAGIANPWACTGAGKQGRLAQEGSGWLFGMLPSLPHSHTSKLRRGGGAVFSPDALPFLWFCCSQLLLILVSSCILPDCVSFLGLRVDVFILLSTWSLTLAALCLRWSTACLTCCLWLQVSVVWSSCSFSRRLPCFSCLLISLSKMAFEYNT